MFMEWIFGIGALLLLVVLSLATAFACYKRCRSDQILVVYGKVGTGESARCIHGGAAFVWPLLQGYQFLDLTPMFAHQKVVLGHGGHMLVQGV